MSFSGEVKQELVQQIPGARHCRKAMLAALLFFCGTVEIEDETDWQLVFRTEQEVVCEVFQLLLQKVFHPDADVILREDRLRGKTCLYIIRITDTRLVQRLLQEIEMLDPHGRWQQEERLREKKLLQKECCRRAYIQAAFLAAGTLSNPQRSYHFAISCTTETDAGQLAELLATLSIEAAIARRGRMYAVYVKEADQIVDLLGLMGARVSLLDFENARIVREVRGNVNRKVNCETANIRKTAQSAAEQIRQITYLEETIGLESLPGPLDEIAHVRVQYPTATLEELGALLDPPVGKSGVNHRLRRLRMLAEQIRVREGGETC